MKASASLLTLFLIAAGCTDATTIPTGLKAPRSASGAQLGNVPPPPADVAVAVCTAGGCAVFEGTYMSNGATADELTAALIARVAGDGGFCPVPGHASLKIDKPLENQFSDFDEGTTSANAQIKCHQQIATGNGTLEIGGVVVNFNQVDFFDNRPDCGFSCGEFFVRDEAGNDIAIGIIVEREAFEDANCYISYGEGEGEPGTPQCYSGSEG